MKISIKWDKRKLTLRFPTGLVLNRLTAGTVRRKLEEEGIHLTRKQIVLLIRELKLYKKRHRNWNLVEVQESNGGSVVVKI